MAIDDQTVVTDGTLEFSEFSVVETATAGDESGITDGNVSGSRFNEGLNFTDFSAYASGPNSRVDAMVSYTVTQTDPASAINQIGSQFNIAVDIDGQSVNFGADGPSRDLGDIEAKLVHSVYAVNEDGTRGELVGSVTLDVRDPDFRDPPYESTDFLLEDSYRELMVETQLILDTNTTNAKLTLSVLENTYDSGPAPVDPGTASLGDYVWFDTDKDGIQDAGEAGAAGVEVTLTGAGADGVFGNADDISKTTTTDANGNYLFDNLNAGDYKVTFGTLAGYEFTTASSANADVTANDSDARAGGQTTVVNLSVGEAERDVDAGLIKTDTGNASIGNQVWFDTNKNGVRDNGETGAQGVTVKLTGAGSDGVFGTADDISKTTTTSNGGWYLFDNLDAGDYKVTFGTLNGYEFTTPSTSNADAADLDSDARAGGETTVVNLSIGEAERKVDAGLIKTDTGNASLGDKVWFDTNKNGLQDAGEAGAAGVTVKLTGAGKDGVFGNADDISKTTTTDANGNYLFDNLNAGDYKVIFGTLPDYAFTTKGTAAADANANDSDAGANGMSSVVNLTIGEAERKVDAGLIKTDTGNASLGDKVWFDTNKNGLQDAGEAGAAGVTVKLTGAGKDGVFGNADDISKTTTTDANGNYLFDNLNAGDYKVTFGTLPDYAFTTKGTAAADANANDSDAGANGMSSVVNLSIGEAERDVDAGLVQTGKEICVEIVRINPTNGNIMDSNSDLEARYATFGIRVDQPVTEDTTFEVVLTNGTAAYGKDYWFGGMRDDRGRSVEVTIKAGETVARLPERVALIQEDISVNNDRSFETFNLTVRNPQGNDLDTFKCMDGYTFKIQDRPTSPIALDLNQDDKIGVTGATTAFDKSGLEVSDKTVSFDIDADGSLDQIEWLSGDGDAFLFDNRDGNAINDMNGSRLFGDANGHVNGYEKLAELDLDADGMLRGNELEGLQLWVDNGDAVLTEDEIVLLSEAGVIGLSADMELVKDADGRDLMQSFAELENGQKMLTEDVWFMHA